MLDMGFEEDMEKILSYAPEKRQTLLFSATLPKWVNKVARRFQVCVCVCVCVCGDEDIGTCALALGSHAWGTLLSPTTAVIRQVLVDLFSAVMYHTRARTQSHTHAVV